MSVIGLSIVIATISLLCYRCLPSSWLILQWLQHPSLISSSKKHVDNGSSTKVSELPSLEDVNHKSSANGMLELSTSPQTEAKNPTKQDLDREAMPPPPQPLKKPLQTSITLAKPPDPPYKPRASSQRSLNLPVFPVPEAVAKAEPLTPSFPAPNSVQRASGGIRVPPRPDPSSVAGGALMPPPIRSTLPLPNRGPPSSSSSLSPPPTHSSVPAKPRRKVLLSPGHSPLDWAHLSSSQSANLSGLPAGTSYLKVPPSLLKQMTGRRGKDAWTVLGGKVYNITPYMPYHPGGELELMKAAGRDGTRLFGEVHPWINWEGMLEGCLVGLAVEEVEMPRSGSLEDMD